MKYAVVAKISRYVTVEIEADDIQDVIENYEDKVCEKYSDMDELTIDEIVDNELDQQVAYRKGDNLLSTKDDQVLLEF